MARPARLHREERKAGILTFTLLFFLSHGIWSTLQCTSRAGMPEQTSEYPPGGGEYGERSDEPERTQRDPSAKSYQVCQSRLTDQLNRICAGKYHDPSMRPRLVTKRDGSVVINRRIPRNVVDECCKKSCNATEMRKYCMTGIRTEAQIEAEDSEIFEETQPDEPEIVDQLENPPPVEEESVSPLLIPILQIFSKLLPPTTAPSLGLPPPPPVYGERDLPIPQPRIQDRQPPANTYNRNFYSGYSHGPGTSSSSSPGHHRLGLSKPNPNSYPFPREEQSHLHRTPSAASTNSFNRGPAYPNRRPPGQTLKGGGSGDRHRHHNHLHTYNRWQEPEVEQDGGRPNITVSKNVMTSNSPQTLLRLGTDYYN